MEKLEKKIHFLLQLLNSKVSSRVNKLKKMGTHGNAHFKGVSRLPEVVHKFGPKQLLHL